jgi:signal transduction histidine kinase
MTLVPQSLFGRLFTALVGVVIVTLLLVAVLIARERRDLAFLGTGAWNTTKAIADTSVTLSRLSGAERDAAIQNLHERPLLLDEVRRRRSPPRTAEQRVIEDAFARQLRRQLGPRFGVNVQRASPQHTSVIRVEGARWIAPGTAGVASQPDTPIFAPAPQATAVPSSQEFANTSNRRPSPGRRAPYSWLFDVTVTLPDGERVMYRALAPLPAPPLPRQIFVELGVLTVLLGVALFVMARTITRPLRDLANAADAVGRGANHPPLAEKGARELRRATRAFNTMQERLRRYLESRTRVVAAMSHDLRTTLTRLRLRAESIENDELRARFAADLDEMSQMVHGALALFRGLNDDEPLDRVDVDVLLETLQADFAELGASVTIEGHTNAPICARPLALKRCLTNILHNAVSYGTRATVLIRDGEELTIRIRDEGPGIPAEAIDQVFEPFFRIEPSRNRDTGGAGLGLSIARDIVQAHGGSISLHNLDRGLEVVINLPRAESVTAPTLLPVPRRNAAETGEAAA